MKHIGINAQLLSSSLSYRRAGIHHYINQLLNHLPAGGEEFKFSVYCNDGSDLALNRSFSLMTSRWPTSRRFARILWEQLVWPLAAARQQVDLLHSMGFVTPVFAGRDTIVTVYDLSFIHYPDRFPAIQRAYLTSQTERSCRQAQRIVTISEAGRRDVHDIFNIQLDQIDVVYPGVDVTFSPRSASEIESFRRKQNLNHPYILHVGTLQPRKRIPTLIEAFSQIKNDDLELILVGGKGWFYDDIFTRVQELGLQDRVRFTGYVPDTDLPLWYNGAAMMVLPSEYEGFGLPVAQAMACGTPVIAADTSAIPEVTGDAGLLFNLDDVAALSIHIASVLDEPQIRATMREEGLAQARKFTWERTGQEMIKVYRKTLNIGR